MTVTTFCSFISHYTKVVTVMVFYECGLIKFITYGTLELQNEGGLMPTRLPRLNVVLEKHTFEAIERLAKDEKVSLSLMAKDLIKDALFVREDIFWAKEAELRLKSLDNKKALSHKDIWL